MLHVDKFPYPRKQTKVTNNIQYTKRHRWSVGQVWSGTKYLRILCKIWYTFCPINIFACIWTFPQCSLMIEPLLLSRLGLSWCTGPYDTSLFEMITSKLIRTYTQAWLCLCYFMRHNMLTFAPRNNGFFAGRSFLFIKVYTINKLFALWNKY